MQFIKKYVKFGLMMAIIAFFAFQCLWVSAAGEKGATITVGGELLEVYTLQKAGNDDESFVILFLADGYTSSEQDKLLSDVTTRANTLLRTEPFRSCSDRINIYTVPTVSAETGVSEMLYGEYLVCKDTYFKIAHQGTTTSFTRDGEAKANGIKRALENSFLDSGAVVGTTHIVSNSLEHFGSSTTSAFSFASLNGKYTGGEATIHEIGHSIGGLKDEYRVTGNYVNVSNSNKKDEVKWKEFLGFRGVGIFPNGLSDSSYIPTLSCIMLNTDNGEFCPVCQMELVRRMNLEIYTKKPIEYYIAQPDITIRHSDTSTDANAYKNYKINESNVANVNGNDVEFRTVVQNYTSVKRSFKLVFRITDINGTDKYFKEEIFEIPPFLNDDSESTKKSISLKFENVSGVVASDKITGQVIDCKTEKVVATERTERIPMSKIIIHHKIIDEHGNKKEMTNTLTSVVYISKGTVFSPPEMKQLNGYSYIGNDWIDGDTPVTYASVDVDFYYKDTRARIEVTKDEKKFTINPVNIATGSAVVLATYDDGLVEAEKYIYDGNEIEHIVNNDFSYAKVFAWKNLNDLSPICVSVTK